MDFRRAMAMALFCALAGCGVGYGSSPPRPPAQEARAGGDDSLTAASRKAFEAGSGFRIVNKLEGDALLVSASYLPKGSGWGGPAFGLRGIDVGRTLWFRVGAHIALTDPINMPIRVALSPDQRRVITAGSLPGLYEIANIKEATWKYKALFGFPPNWEARHGRERTTKKYGAWLLVVTDVVTSEPVAVFDYDELFPGYRSPGLETIAQYSFSPDGQWIYYNGVEDRNTRDPKSYSAMIWRIHVKDRRREVVYRTPVSDYTGVPAYDFVGGDERLLVTDENTPERRKQQRSQMFLVDLDAGDRREVPTTSDWMSVWDLSTVRTCRKAALVDERGLVITRIDEKGGVEQQASHPELKGLVWGLRMSPDGRWVICSREHERTMWLYLYNAETQELQWILRPTAAGGLITQGVWSDDGRYFAGYIRTARATNHLLVIDINRREIGFFGRHEYALALAFITKPDVIEAIRARSRAYGEPQFFKVSDRHVKTSRYGLSDWYASLDRPFFGGWMKPDTPEADGGGWTIDTIMDGRSSSLLKATGLRPDDRLVTIDGERPANAQACWTKLEVAILKADRVVLGFQRGTDEPMKFTVEIVERLPVPE